MSQPTPTDSWESRMAERAHRREVVRVQAATRQVNEAAREAYAAAEQRPWLNGWPRTGRTVRMGTGIHCVGCGRCQGITCTAFPPDWEPPGPEPVWPFTEADCPLCAVGGGV